MVHFECYCCPLSSPPFTLLELRPHVLVACLGCFLGNLTSILQAVFCCLAPILHCPHGRVCLVLHRLGHCHALFLHIVCQGRVLVLELFVVLLRENYTLQ